MDAFHWQNIMEKDKHNKKIIDTVMSYYNLMVEKDVQELHAENKKLSIKIKRRLKTSQPEKNISQVPTNKQIPSENTNTKLIPITAPLSGIFYRSPSPTAPSFVKEGDIITEGKVLCIIEAMKVMNEIKSNYAGKIVKILPENAQPVSEGQILFYIQPS